MNTDELLARAAIMLVYDEGLRRQPYDCATGKKLEATGAVTIGVGRNLDARPLSDGVIFAILREDIEIAHIDAKEFVGLDVWVALTTNRKLALINLAFNMGLGRLRTFKKMRAALLAGDFMLAGGELLDSKWARQVDPMRLDGRGRDDRVFAMLTNDEWPYK